MKIFEITHFYVNYLFDFFLVVNNNKKWKFVVDNIILGTYYPINLWKCLKTHLNVNYLFDYFLIVNYNKKWKFVVENIIFGTCYPINLWKCYKTNLIVNNLFDYFLIVNYNKKWEYFVDNIIFGPSYPIYLWKSLKKHISMQIIYFYFSRLQNKYSYYVLFILIFRIGLPYYPMTIFENTFLCILCISFLFNRKEPQKVRICCW